MSNRSRDVGSARLDWPSEWGKERPAAVFLFVPIFFALTALVSVSMFIDAVQYGRALQALYGVAIGLSSLPFLMIAVLHLKVRRTKLPSKISVLLRDDTGRSGINLPYISSWKPLVLLLMVGAAFAFFVRGMLTLSDVNSGKYNSVRNGLGIGGLASTAVFLVLIAAFLFYVYRPGNRPGAVLIHEYGVLQELGQTTRVIAWEDIGQVLPCVVNKCHVVRIAPVSGRRISVDTRRSLLDRWQRGYFERIMDVPVWVLGMDPPLFLNTVLFYWQNPEVRAELRTESAIERMRRGELVPSGS